MNCKDPSFVTLGKSQHLTHVRILRLQLRPSFGKRDCEDTGRIHVMCFGK